MRTQHYLATESRTLCGTLLRPGLKALPTWPDFLRVYEHAPNTVCLGCLRHASKYANWSRSLADLNNQLNRKPFYLPRRRRQT